MSLQYGDVPPGGQVNIPPAIPSGMLYRMKQISGISKQTLKLVPLSGQTTVSNGGKIIVALPPNSLVDLSTFELILEDIHNMAVMDLHGPQLQELQQITRISLINDIFLETLVHSLKT